MALTFNGETSALPNGMILRKPTPEQFVGHVKKDVEGMIRYMDKGQSTGNCWIQYAEGPRANLVFKALSIYTQVVVREMLGTKEVDEVTVWECKADDGKKTLDPQYKPVEHIDDFCVLKISFAGKPFIVQLVSETSYPFYCPRTDACYYIKPESECPFDPNSDFSAKQVFRHRKMKSSVVRVTDSIEEEQGICLMFAMSAHARLGEKSAANVLHAELLQKILVAADMNVGMHVETREQQSALWAVLQAVMPAEPSEATAPAPCGPE